MLEEKLIAGHDDGDTLSDVVEHEMFFCFRFVIISNIYSRIEFQFYVLEVS